MNARMVIQTLTTMALLVATSMSFAQSDELEANAQSPSAVQRSDESPAETKEEQQVEQSTPIKPNRPSARFDPTEEISKDLSVSFPVDI